MLMADDCIEKNCDKTWPIPSNEDLAIKVSPCDKCTSCGNPFETPTIVTERAWWYYKLPNGSWTEEINATVINGRDYEIKVSFTRNYQSRNHPQDVQQFIPRNILRK